MSAAPIPKTRCTRFRACVAKRMEPLPVRVEKSPSGAERPALACDFAGQKRPYSTKRPPDWNAHVDPTPGPRDEGLRAAAMPSVRELGSRPAVINDIDGTNDCRSLLTLPLHRIEWLTLCRIPTLFADRATQSDCAFNTPFLSLAPTTVKRGA